MFVPFCVCVCVLDFISFCHPPVRTIAGSGLLLYGHYPDADIFLIKTRIEISRGGNKRGRGLQRRGSQMKNKQGPQKEEPNHFD